MLTTTFLQPFRWSRRQVMVDEIATGYVRRIVIKTVPATFRPRVPDSVSMLLDVESRNRLLDRRLSVEYGRAESASHKLLIRRS
jgi:hypothetical protein